MNIDQDLAERLGDMAGFRNLLVHRYGDVDNEHILEMIESELEDVVEFERAVVRFMDCEVGESPVAGTGGCNDGKNS